MSTEDSMEVEGSDANNSASEANSHTDIFNINVCTSSCTVYRSQKKTRRQCQQKTVWRWRVLMPITQPRKPTAILIYLT